jgi:hypothetical protein
MPKPKSQIHIWTFRILRRVNQALIIVSVVVVPVSLLAFGLKNGGRSTLAEVWWQVSLIGIGALVMFIRFFYVLGEGNDEFGDLQAELKFLFLGATSAWSFGGGLACILTALFFLFPVNGAWYERYTAGLSIYISILGVVLGVHAFYRRTAPITDLNHLLKAITEDLENLIGNKEENESTSERLWIVYPALNLGYYRNMNSLRVYYRYKDAVIRCATHLKTNAHAITFSEDLYQPLYEVYDKGANKGIIDPGRVKRSVDDAKDFVDRFKGARVATSKFYGVDPISFPPHVFIIGDITYLLMSYGVPIYDPDLPEKFRAIEGEEFAKILAFRRDDPSLAVLISDHLKLLVEKPEAPPQGESTTAGTVGGNHI